jgi:hypothetical protein
MGWGFRCELKVDRDHGWRANIEAIGIAFHHRARFCLCETFHLRTRSLSSLGQSRDSSLLVLVGANRWLLNCDKHRADNGAYCIRASASIMPSYLVILVPVVAAAVVVLLHKRYAAKPHAQPSPHKAKRRTITPLSYPELLLISPFS